MTKVFGSDDAVTNQINTITQGIGGDLIPIEANTGGVGSVDSVNGMIGDVTLTTDDVPEGATNFYIDAAQETLITNALQPADNISVLTNDAGYVDNVSDETIGGIKQFTSNETYFGPSVIGLGNTNQFSILAQSGIYLRENAPGNNAYFGIYDASLNWTSRFVTNTATHVWDLIALSGTATLQVEGVDVILSGDNVSSLTNDAGYITSAGAPVQTVFGRAGDVVAISTDYSAFYASTAQGALADTALQPGDVTSTNYSSTSNEITKVGDYGLGVGPGVTAGSYDSAVVPGFYFKSANQTNAPITGESIFLQVIAGSASGTNNRIVQIAYTYASGPRQFMRSYGGATWTAWAEVPTSVSENILFNHVVNVQYHTNADGTLKLGANLNGGNALTTLTTKRFTITCPNYDSTFTDIACITANSSAVQNTLYFGFSGGGLNSLPTEYVFRAASDLVSTSTATIFTLNFVQANFDIPVQLQTYTVGTLPTVINDAVIMVSDGDAGSPCLAVGIGGAWVRLVTGSAVSTTSRGLAPITIDTASVSSVTLNATHYERTLYVIGTGALDINLDATADAGKFANVINHSSGVVQFVASGTTVNAPTNGTLVIPQFGTASAFGVTSSIWQISGQTVPA